MIKERTFDSKNSVFYLFKRRSKLTYPQIAQLTGLSVSHLKKMGCGEEQISDKVALVLSSRFGAAMDSLLSKRRNAKLLNDDGEEWHPFDAGPPGTADDYASNDLRKAYIRALEACAKEAGLSLPSDKEQRLRIAKAIEGFNPLSTGADIDKLKPHRAETARHVAALYKKWYKRNSIGKKADEIPLQGYFEKKKDEFLPTARRTPRKDIMELFELLLVDASYHPQSPLIAGTIIKSLLSIRDEFRVQKRCKVALMTYPAYRAFLESPRGRESGKTA